LRRDLQYLLGRHDRGIELAQFFKVRSFGADVPLGRLGEPEEMAPSYVFLGSDDAS
jgi:NAD(P)-dependent dehydrogenase (short-subunit alcohol dehydrogenase family)